MPVEEISRGRGSRLFDLLFGRTNNLFFLIIKFLILNLSLVKAI